jgi:hypothetical protein
LCSGANRREAYYTVRIKGTNNEVLRSDSKPVVIAASAVQLALAPGFAGISRGNSCRCGFSGDKFGDSKCEADCKKLTNMRSSCTSCVFKAMRQVDGPEPWLKGKSPDHLANPGNFGVCLAADKKDGLTLDWCQAPMAPPCGADKNANCGPQGARPVTPQQFEIVQERVHLCTNACPKSAESAADYAKKCRHWDCFYAPETCKRCPVVAFDSLKETVVTAEKGIHTAAAERKGLLKSLDSSPELRVGTSAKRRLGETVKPLHQNGKLVITKPDWATKAATKKPEVPAYDKPSNTGKLHDLYIPWAQHTLNMGFGHDPGLKCTLKGEMRVPKALKVDPRVMSEALYFSNKARALANVRNELKAKQRAVGHQYRAQKEKRAKAIAQTTRIKDCVYRVVSQKHKTRFLEKHGKTPEIPQVKSFIHLDAKRYLCIDAKTGQGRIEGNFTLAKRIDSGCRFSVQNLKQGFALRVHLSKSLKPNEMMYLTMMGGKALGRKVPKPTDKFKRPMVEAIWNVAPGKGKAYYTLSTLKDKKYLSATLSGANRPSQNDHWQITPCDKPSWLIKYENDYMSEYKKSCRPEIDIVTRADDGLMRTFPNLPIPAIAHETTAAVGHLARVAGIVGQNKPMKKPIAEMVLSASKMLWMDEECCLCSRALRAMIKVQRRFKKRKARGEQLARTVGTGSNFGHKLNTALVKAANAKVLELEKAFFQGGGEERDDDTLYKGIKVYEDANALLKRELA